MTDLVDLVELVADASTASFGVVKMRYVGTIHLPSTFGSDENSDLFFEKHPRRAREIQGVSVLISHSPSEFPAIPSFGDRPAQNTCMDVWVACREDNYPPGTRSSKVKIHTNLRDVEKWRKATKPIRRDDLMSLKRPSTDPVLPEDIKAPSVKFG